MSLRRLAVTALLAFVVAAPAAHASGTSSELGLDLIPWSKKVAERRYESPRDYEGTLKFFKDKFKGWKNVKWTREVNLPTVKYVHIENTNPEGKWQGVNIYAMPDGKVRYFVLDHPKKPGEASPPAADAAKPAKPAKQP